MNLSILKIEIIVLQKVAYQFLEELQKIGEVEIIGSKKESSEEISKKREGIELILAELNFAKSFLVNFAKKEGFIVNFLNSFIPNKLKFSLEDLEELSNSIEITKTIKRSSEIEEEVNKLKLKTEKLLREKNSLNSFFGINVNLKNACFLKGFNCFLGNIKKENKKKYLNEIEKAKTPFFIEWGRGNQSLSSFILIYSKKENVFFDDIVKKYDIKKEEMFLIESPEKEIEKRVNEIDKLNKATFVLIKEAEEISLIIPKIEALIDWFNWEFQKYSCLEIGDKTKTFFCVKAWAIKNSIPKIKEKIEKISSVYFLRELPLNKGENVPVIIKNKGITGSFEAVTRIYGLPASNELDPTPYLAPFFALFFGIALSDIGYGMLLSIFAFLGKKKLKGRGVDSFFNLLILVGICTIIAGIFMGTFFGTNITAKMRIMDPMADPVKFLIFVFILGLFQIIVGLLIGMIWNIKQKNITEAMGRNASSIILISSIILSIVLSDKIFFINGIIVSFLLSMIFTNTKKFILRISSGLSSLYGLIGYLSDVLSYSRLLALGLATGVIAMVINITAGIIKDMIPVFGILIAGFILIFGHIFNLLLNSLSAFIHSARLQFVEFFSKFMKGGGNYFKPLSKQGRFIEIINK